MQPNLIFLLGGIDLEMLTIEELLIENGIACLNRKLTWDTSKVTAYADIIRSPKYAGYQLYGIELIENNRLPLPGNYQSIDHHNDRVNEKSSVEQVADILGVKLTRHQMLVAANDKGYIAAMEEMGATREEILQIRFMDRQAQGVTTEDEALAEESIRKHKTVVGDVILINSLTPHFSAITDRLYPAGKILISYSNHFSYYGPGIELLANNFKHLIKRRKLYHGGGRNGYFGAGVDEFRAEEIDKIKNEVIQIVKNSDHA